MAIIPTSALKLVLENLTDEPVFIAVETTFVVFKQSSFILRSMLVQGRFPDYKRIVPRSSDIKHRFSIPAKRLAEHLKRLAPFTTVELRGTKFTLSTGSLLLTVATDRGKARSKMIVDYDGPEIVTSYDGRYLIDHAAVCGDSVVEWWMIAADDRPLLSFEKYRYVLMPLQCD